MNKILNMMKKYSKKHSIIDGITLEVEEDGSGCVLYYLGNEEIFDFGSIEELKEKLNN